MNSDKKKSARKEYNKVDEENLDDSFGSDEDMKERKETSNDEDSRPIGGNHHQDEDPYLSLGFGMVAYFDLLWLFIRLFAFFTLLSIFPILVYKSFDGMKDATNYSRAKYSIGNIGFQEASCQRSFFGIEKPKQYSCRDGFMSELKFAGIIPYENSYDDA